MRRNELVTLTLRLNQNQIILGDPEVTVNPYSNFEYLDWEGCVICSIYLRKLLGHPVCINYIDVDMRCPLKCVQCTV